MKRLATLLLCLGMLPAFAQEDRQYVEMPAPMREHMLANMRDHLAALQDITRLLSAQQYEQAAELAENRLGMTSLQGHGASHMAQIMPPAMADTGTAMHRAASRFALAARDAAVEGGLQQAFAALSEVMQQCVACHDAYRVH